MPSPDECLVISEWETGKEKCISKLGTRKESYSQNQAPEKTVISKFEPEKNFARKTVDQKNISALNSEIHNYIPIPDFENKILYQFFFLMLWRKSSMTQ